MFLVALCALWWPASHHSYRTGPHCSEETWEEACVKVLVIQEAPVREEVKKPPG